MLGKCHITIYIECNYIIRCGETKESSDNIPVFVRKSVCIYTKTRKIFFRSKKWVLPMRKMHQKSREFWIFCAFSHFFAIVLQTQQGIWHRQKHAYCSGYLILIYLDDTWSKNIRRNKYSKNVRNKILVEAYMYDISIFQLKSQTRGKLRLKTTSQTNKLFVNNNYKQTI